MATTLAGLGSTWLDPAVALFLSTSLTTSSLPLLLAATGALIVMMCFYTSYNFLNFHSVDAIDVTSVTLSRLKFINS